MWVLVEPLWSVVIYSAWKGMSFAKAPSLAAFTSNLPQKWRLTLPRDTSDGFLWNIDTETDLAPRYHGCVKGIH